MLSNDTISVGREKLELGGDSRTDVPPRLVMKNNRAAFVLTRSPITEKLVVLSHTLVSTVRMSSLAAAFFMRDKLAFRGDTPPDWKTGWESISSPFERHIFPDLWVAVYINGKRVFSTVKDEFPPGNGVFIQQLDAIEAVAMGGDVTDAMLRAVLGTLAPGQPVKRETQTAVVLTETKDQTRCAIMERGGGHKKSVSFTIMNDAAPITLSAMLSITGGMLELVNLADWFNRNGPKKGKETSDAPKVSNELLKIAMDRRKEMITVIRGFERAYKVRYRPDRPACLEITPPPAPVRKAL